MHNVKLITQWSSSIVFTCNIISGYWMKSIKDAWGNRTLHSLAVNNFFITTFLSPNMINLKKIDLLVIGDNIPEYIQLEEQAALDKSINKSALGIQSFIIRIKGSEGTVWCTVECGSWWAGVPPAAALRSWLRGNRLCLITVPWAGSHTWGMTEPCFNVDNWSHWHLTF